MTTGQAAEGVSLRRVGGWRPAGQQPPGKGESPWSACVLVCAHKLRDKRCGVAGPMIIEELRSECESRGLGGSVAVLGCSHVGGHKFAGNLIVYSGAPAAGHWYGRVKPCHAPALVETHIMQGKVIKELWRGRMEA